MEKTNARDALKELTMILMYLSKFTPDKKFNFGLDMTWKGYDFNVINELDEEDYIRQGSRRSKSVLITKDGEQLARELLEKYNINDWE